MKDVVLNVLSEFSFGNRRIISNRSFAMIVYSLWNCSHALRIRSISSIRLAVCNSDFLKICFCILSVRTASTLYPFIRLSIKLESVDRASQTNGTLRLSVWMWSNKQYLKMLL